MAYVVLFKVILRLQNFIPKKMEHTQNLTNFDLVNRITEL